MAVKAIRENTAKLLINKHLTRPDFTASSLVFVTPETKIDDIPTEHPWVLEHKLVVKPDQLIKRRGKLGLLKVNCTWDEAKVWLTEHSGKSQKIGKAEGILKYFLIEPFVAHQQSEEYYLSIYSTESTDEILFFREGGIDIGEDVESKAQRLSVPVDSTLTLETITSSNLLSTVEDPIRTQLSTLILDLYKIFTELYFTFMEINPLVITNGKINILDLAAKLDQTAEFDCQRSWGKITFPPPFGREATPEEAYIQELDSKTGSSLKLTVINPEGRIWTMVAGGGASVIYSDTICDMGYASELANYGEYSGAPNQSQTYDYAKTILSLLTRSSHPEGKLLFIGGGIANFTNVAATFKGIEKALKEYALILAEQKVQIYVRRGGPNYQEGLRVMRDLGKLISVPIHVFGPETHMTSVVSLALGLGKGLLDGAEDAEEESTSLFPSSSRNKLLRTSSGALRRSKSISDSLSTNAESTPSESTKSESTKSESQSKPLFSVDSKAFIFGMQPQAVQGMLDFDYCCGRKNPSVAGMVYPFSTNHLQKFYWGHNELMLPVYADMSLAMSRHPDVDVVVNFASSRSAYDATVQTLAFDQVKIIAIIAEGIPEAKTRKMIKLAKDKNVTIIGPATVGGIKPGCFKIGNTGGMLDNIISSKLYRPGSVAYVSRSGGMSNELNNVISRVTNGVYEGVAIGGDRYVGSTFFDHMLRYQQDPNTHLLVLLGEVGGTEEYKICQAIKDGRITKPVVAWCIGTCAGLFSSEVQFGHAGALAGSDIETASAKNIALKEAGAIVPSNFDELPNLISTVYQKLVDNGTIVELPEPAPPKVPIDYSWAQELGLIRKPTTFSSSISDERGDELAYAGIPISGIIKDELGIGGVVGLLWFRKKLPDYACKFIEMCLMITADHGPAVSGAHNTIVTARAGKDLVSSLTSGLLTIGDRFGGALDGSARQFSKAYDKGMTPIEFVTTMRQKNKLLMGIGHLIKSINNPDKRCELLKNFAKEHFPSTKMLDYGLEVEKITTSKKPNLILNVDGVIATAFVDLLRESGVFTKEEAEEYIKIGLLNGLFVLGRSIGLIGHYLDQKRLKQGLYRHPWSDITYLPPDQQFGF